MNISTSHKNPVTASSIIARSSSRVASNEQPAQAPQDSFRFSDAVNVGAGMGYGALGLIPGLGGMANLSASNEAAINGHYLKENICTAGMVSNFAGTLALVDGLMSGNSTALYSGLGLLGLSGATAAYARGI